MNLRASIVVLLLSGSTTLTAAPLAGQSSAGVEPLRAAMNGSSLQPGMWAYDILVRLNGEEQRVGTRLLEIDRVVHEGRPAWLLVERSATSGSEVVDSLVLDRTSLEPLRRSLQMGSTRLIADFTADSMRATILGTNTRRPFATLLPPDLVVNEAMLEVLFRLQELRVGWSRRAEQLIVGRAGSAEPGLTDLGVVGSETIVVPAGRFEAWVVTATTREGEQRLWLSREGNVLLRSQTEPPELLGASIETVLTRSVTPP